MSVTPNLRCDKTEPRSTHSPDMGFLEGFSGSSAGKESTCNAGALGLILGWGRPPGERIGMS